MLQTIQGYKTVIFNGIAASVTAIAVFTGHGADAVNVIQSITGSLDSGIAAVVGTIAGVNVILRWFTTTPIFNKETK